MANRLTTAPASEPITATEAKAHCNIIGAGDDTLIASLITAAREHVENLTGRRLITQTWEQVMDAFPAQIRLVYTPTVSVDSITYTDTNGDTQTLAGSAYTSDAYSEPGRVSPVDAWPSTYNAMNAVTVTYKAGYGTAASSVPGPIKAAILLTIGDLYENREGQGTQDLKENQAVMRLLYPYKLAHV